ncbi:IclR family transcriptional regulator [Verminephrobacter aporrectodeae subsp. tuberculatae]|uniref:IclR family transcriptional regulator n=1 Tax=Verminephrobacter aporrectodeae subsp. tuberculatae TaxID=1110392 RepID=A0ABT3KXY4_9BURK|nr:IclR family transcriptional regulator [Verminephrobacter aporrectodeae]MCW5322670.1 IclR family transcriptional regulator [Verminephrobacter aporrectodeae subsp. tuberculatae]MCW8207684.1 IclR family transcriptional regulator [Verminephrobacter aporrectodeae subsp. tuberculatae]
MPAARHPDPDFATTLQHGLQVLHCFTVSDPALGNKELSERTGLSKATISRLTYTLAARGLLVFDAHLRRYRLGSTALTIGYPLMASLRIRQIARARMKQLAEEVGGSVSLGMRERTRMVYIETSRGHDLSAWRPDIGATVPMLPTAMGRAWLAHTPQRLRDVVLEQIEASEPGQRQRFEAALAQAQTDLKRKGFCISRGAWRSDVQAVGVPIRIPQDGETLVLNCGVLTVRLGPRQLEQCIGPRLVAMARSVEADLEAVP